MGLAVTCTDGLGLADVLWLVGCTDEVELADDELVAFGPQPQTVSKFKEMFTPTTGV